MKKIVIGVFLWIFGLPAWSTYLNVPEDAILGQLPEESSILVLRDIKMNYTGSSGLKYKSNYLGDRYSEVYSHIGATLAQGTTLSIQSVALGEWIWVRMRIKDDQDYSLAFRSTKNYQQLPTTVKDFNDWIGEYFRIVKLDPLAYDPYPGVAKDIVVDLIMTKIIKAIESSKYTESIKDFAYLERLGIPLPESFYYY